MPDLTLENILITIFFVIPGAIIMSIRALFITTRIRKSSEAILSYFVISIIYQASVFTILFLFCLMFYQQTLELYWTEKSVYDLINNNKWIIPCVFVPFVFIIPGILGLLLGLDIQRELIYRCVRRWNFKVLDAQKTAWNFKFSQLKPQDVSVLLKDGSEYFGYFGGDSLASSDSNERDIYIQDLRRVKYKDKDKWEHIDQTSVLIAGGEIKTVKFLKRESETKAVKSDEKTE